MQALSIKGLTKQYKNGFQALKGIDLNVEQGDFFALLGPNGAGKSTAIGVITGLVNKTSGSVSVFGHDLDTDVVQAKRHIGLVPQEFNFNVFEPIREVIINQAGYYGISRIEARRRSEHFLKQLDLWDKRHDSARQLSGGMKRRLMIARALVHYPKLLILDEPTAGVDIEIRRSMWDFLTRINEQDGITIILTTHYLEEAESLCRNVAIINRGEIVEHGRVSDLLSRAMVETFVLDIVSDDHKNLDLPDYKINAYTDGQLEVEVEKNKSLNNLFNELSAKNIKVKSMRNKTNRLEEFFLRLVRNQA
ncbi:MAG: ABC transporter ATP-binding protein [Gammaproteobacteria bacterium]|nr:ABC transporter ATP-binding protein [Gammaproteobacteria bacterium]